MIAPAGATDPWVVVLASQTLGQYKLGAVLGRGAFGIVFEAVSDMTGARFAVKVLPPTADVGAQVDFENEGVLLKQLNPCAGVVSFVDGGVHQVQMLGVGGVSIPIDVRYHVMTLASGSLDELILDPSTRGNLGWDERIRLWRSMVKALMQMHLHGVAHRDLKCSNCLLHVSKNQTKIRFGDLGRARDLSLPGRLPPEQYLLGRGDFRFAPPEALFWQGGSTKEDFLAADYYGLGSMLVELITGQSMTSLAIGDFRAALDTGRQDNQGGLQRDLGSLNLKFRAVIDEVVDGLPRAIRGDARAVLESLCDPVPTKRLSVSPYSRDRTSREKLAWILRRADIMIRRVEIEMREERKQAKVSA